MKIAFLNLEVMGMVAIAVTLIMILMGWTSPFRSTSGNGKEDSDGYVELGLLARLGIWPRLVPRL
jgi:hypothetical protein